MRQSLSVPPLRKTRPPTKADLFGLFFQDGASSRVHMMDLMAYRTGHRLIDTAVFGGVFGGETLNSVSSFGASVYEERHVTLDKSQFSRISITDVYLVQCSSSSSEESQITSALPYARKAREAQTNTSWTARLSAGVCSRRSDMP